MQGASRRFAAFLSEAGCLIATIVFPDRTGLMVLSDGTGRGSCFRTGRRGIQAGHHNAEAKRQGNEIPNLGHSELRPSRTKSSHWLSVFGIDASVVFDASFDVSFRI